MADFSLTGESGTVYAFTAAKLVTNPAHPLHAACVYAYHSQVGWLVYLGQTKDLAARHARHMQDNNDTDRCIRGYKPLQLAYHQVADESARIKAEQDLKRSNHELCGSGR